MASIILTVAAIGLVYLFSIYGYQFIRNFYHARASNVPYIVIPWDQNSLFWQVFQIPLRPVLKRRLPTWVFERLDLAIYGFEFNTKMRAFEQCASQGKGNGMSYVIVTPGKFEFSTRDPELVQAITKRPRDFVQHDFMTQFLGIFGGNVFTTDGDEWSRHRRVVAGTLTQKILRTTFEEGLAQTEGLLGEVVGEREAGTTVKLFDMMKKITINVLSGAGMGESVTWDRDVDSDRPEEGYRLSYMQSVKAVFDGMAGPIILPPWILTNYPLQMPGSQFIRRVGVAKEEFPVHTKSLLERERKANIEGAKDGRNNIMSQLLKAAESDQKQHKGASAMSEEEMIGNLFVFTGAGYDTTANTLSYAIVLLARHPEWQDWMCEEIDDLIPAEREIRDLDYSFVFPRATRVMAVMLETLRLFPPVLHLVKQTRSPQTLTTGTHTYYLPAGTTVYVNTVACHLEPTVYRNVNIHPGEKASDTDELVFRPTRWVNIPSIGSSSPLWQPPSGTYVPWSAGPRICPGQKMAQVEFVSIFLILFRQHRLEAVALNKAESRQEVEKRLEEKMSNSSPILTLQMNDVYNVEEGEKEKGLSMRLLRRK